MEEGKVVFLLGVGVFATFLLHLLTSIIFLVCSFFRGFWWGVLTLFTGYIGAIIGFCIPGEKKPVKSFIANIVTLVLFIAVFVMFGIELEKMAGNHELRNGKIWKVKGEGLEKPAPLPAPENFEEAFVQGALRSNLLRKQEQAKAAGRQGGASNEGNVREESDSSEPGGETRPETEPVPTSGFNPASLTITSVMGALGTPEVTVTFNGKHMVDVGQTFEVDQDGTTYRVKLLSMGETGAQVEVDGQTHTVPRQQVAEGVQVSRRVEPGTWTDDHRAALEEARRSGKKVFMLFTATEWCPACRNYRDEVLTQPEFLEYAKANVVLLKLEFPRQSPLPPDKEAANRELARTFGVNAFPTTVILNPDGTEAGRQVSYFKGGPATNIQMLQRNGAP